MRILAVAIAPRLAWEHNMKRDAIYTNKRDLASVVTLYHQCRMPICFETTYMYSLNYYGLGWVCGLKTDVNSLSDTSMETHMPALHALRGMFTNIHLINADAIADIIRDNTRKSTWNIMSLLLRKEI